MSSISHAQKLTELKPRIAVIGVGGAGGNAINNMIASGIDGVEFVAANTDAQALLSSSAEHRIQLGATLTEGLGAGAKPEIGEAAAKEAINEICSAIAGSHMVFIAAGMGGGTGTGILTVAIVTKPFNFEGNRRMKTADAGIELLRSQVDTLIVIPNQNLFRIANERTTFAEAFLLADQVLHSGIACITDLIVREGLINLDFADVRAVMSGMGSAMMGTGEAAGEHRAIEAAELAILNPLLDDVTLRGARGLLVSISGSRSLTLFEVDEAAERVRREVDPDANIIIGATFDETLGDKLRVSIVASGLSPAATASRLAASASPPPHTLQSAAYQPAPAYRPQADYASEMAPVAEAYVPAQRYESAPAQAPEAVADEAAYQTYAASPDAEARAWIAHSAGTDAGAPSYDETAAETWSNDSDVVIELGTPEHVSSGRTRHEQTGSDRAAYDRTPAFRSAAPQDGRRQTRRLPEVEDFPEFAQAAYHARRAEPAPEPRSAAAVPADKRAGGLFNYLTGRKAATIGPGESAMTDRERAERAAKAQKRNPWDALPPYDEAESDAAQSASDASRPRRVPMPRHRPR